MAMAMDCRSVFPGRGGIGRYAENLARRMPDLGSEDYVLFTTNRQQERICNASNVQQISFDCGMIDASWEQLQLPAILEDYAIELYHNPCFSLPVAKEKAKLVATIHDVVFRERPDMVEKRLCEYLNQWTEVACKVADCVIAVSEYSKKQLVNFYGIESSKVEVIYNGIDKKFRRAQKEEQEKAKKRYRLPQDFIMYLGAIEPKKNLDRLLDAQRIVKEKHPECFLAIAGGKGPMDYDLEKAIRVRRLENSVAVIGYVEEQDIVPLLSAARVFVYPSLYEGFGFPPLEAMACGTPTIVSDATSLPEVVGDGAKVVATQDSEGLAVTIETFLLDEEEAKDYAVKGKERASLFTWEECVEKTWKLYQRIARKPERKA
ncbi:MAG: glycosyltransferase family 4 protein [Candidatus Brocadiae bacterium]|nr:glycosyltransferase family 4 protein [Candidatus Brocadiia bacterium]